MKLAIIGSGPTAIYILNHLLISEKSVVQEIHIFEKESLMGMGMPYNPTYVDKYHLANVSSEEIPVIITPFADWLREQSDEILTDLDIERRKINDKEMYSRIALGRYLHSQYTEILEKFKEAGKFIFQYPDIEVLDIMDEPDQSLARIYASDGSNMALDFVIIATGHDFDQSDKPEIGFFKSPWPVEKILPHEGSFYNFEVGLMGASLSAFDIATSLAHRHGKFLKQGKRLSFKRHTGAERFKIKMHSAEGWLPHLQYEQKNPRRKIYRCISKTDLLKLLDRKGYLRIETYFDRACRPVLYNSLSANGYVEEAERLNNPNFSFADFIEKMSEGHEYKNPFVGMHKEMKEARVSVEENIPIYWKEAMDDLMFTLNFHLEMVPAEDRMFFRERVMPFMMNVIAALPLQSAHILLALHDAGALDMVKGKIENVIPESHSISIQVVENGIVKYFKYSVFIECGGDKIIKADSFPFRSLVTSGSVRSCRAAFANAIENEETHDETVFKEKGNWFKILPGIDVDSAYRIIGSNGLANPRIYNPTFTHIQGVRPYSYSLEACNVTAEILIEHFENEEAKNHIKPVQPG